MKNQKKKEIIQWVVLIALMVVLWITGWHRPIIAGAQKLILATGIMQPEIPKVAKSTNIPGVDMSLIDENGNHVKLSDFRGKTVLLNFWATWCPPCIAEMPGIEKLYNKVSVEDIQFVMLSVDDDFQKAQAFKKRKNYSFPIYSVGGPTHVDLQSDEVPTTYIIDPNGVIQMKHSGIADYDTEKFKAFLNKLSKP